MLRDCVELAWHDGVTPCNGRKETIFKMEDWYQTPEPSIVWIMNLQTTKPKEWKCHLSFNSFLAIAISQCEQLFYDRYFVNKILNISDKLKMYCFIINIGWCLPAWCCRQTEDGSRLETFRNHYKRCSKMLKMLFLILVKLKF